MIARSRVLLLAMSLLSVTRFALAQRPDPSSLDPLPHTNNEDTDKTGVKAAIARKHTNRGGGWVIAGFLGASHTAPSSLTISQPALANDLAFQDVQLRSESFKGPFYYGLRGGYFLPRIPWFGIETEFIHFKAFSSAQQIVRATGVYHGTPINRDLPLGQIVQRYSISHGVNLLLVNFVARYRLGRSAEYPDGRFILSARAGVGPTLPHTESNVDSHPQEQYQTGRGGWQLSGGSEVRIWRRWYAFVEYKFTRTRQRGKIFSGTAQSLLRTQHVIFGLSYHFDPVPKNKARQSDDTPESPPREEGRVKQARSNRFELFGGYKLLRAPRPSR